MSSRAPGVKVGLAQLELAPLDVESNIATSVAAVHQAAAAGATLVVLPELCNSGYVLDRALLWNTAESVDDPGPALLAWAGCAAELGITIVAGFAERDGDRLFNSAVVFGPSGERVGSYRKLHLFAGELDVFSPGDTGLPIFEVAGLRLGVLICYDLRFPEALRILAVENVDLIAVPTAWVGGFDHEADKEADIGQVRTVRVLANLNATPVACASQVGQSGPFSFLGSSVLVDAFGMDEVGPAPTGQPVVLITDLDPATRRLARDRGAGMTPLQQRRTDVYDELLGYTRRTASSNVLGEETNHG